MKKITQSLLSNNKVHFPAYDLNGNVMGLVNAANGNISAKYEYGPFGEVFCSVGDMAKVNPFGFLTKYTDNETDLLYYGYRYYSPALGRWLSRDPIEEQGGLNLYGFVNNDPVNGYDILGLMRWVELLEHVEKLDAFWKGIKCCCCEKTFLVAEITGFSSGETITHTVNIKKSGCTETIDIIAYYWWDCVSAQRDYRFDNSATRPRGRQAWQDYGWHKGGNPQTMSHKGMEKHWWDLWDMNHWNWQVAIIYRYCSKNQYRVKMRLSNALEWTWHDEGWGEPHEGAYGTIN